MNQSFSIKKVTKTATICVMKAIKKDITL